MNKMKNTKIVELDENLAEFIGILLGDGHLRPTNYEISITGSLVNDKEYIKSFVKNKVINLFNISPLIYKQKGENTIRCKFYSKEVFDYLTKKFNMCTGNKTKHELKIPKQIKSNCDLLKACIRGLIDTDGGVYRHHKKSAQLLFYSKNKSLLEDVQHSLFGLGYKPRRSKRKTGEILYLFNKDVNKYFKEIGTNNFKNQAKYDAWQKEGVMPKNPEALLY